MKLYSKNTGKFATFFGLGLMILALCSVMLFSGLINLTRVAFAEESVSSTTEEVTYKNSLEGFSSVGKELKIKDSTSIYLISSVEDLQLLAYYINKGTEGNYTQYATASYEMTDDLDLSIFSFWEAIGTEKRPFMGQFNGGGNSIYGLTIIEDTEITTSQTSESTETEQTEAEETVDTYRGLFGCVAYDNSATDTTDVVIKNLGLKDTLIKSKGTYTGGLIGRAIGYANAGAGKVTVSECYNTGYVEGADFVGGLVGSMEQRAVVKNSYFMFTVRDLDRYNTGVVNSKYDVVTNTNAGYVGGIAGYAVDSGSDVVIKNCYNAGIVGQTANLSEVERGALVGYRSDLSNLSGLKSYNFFLKGVLPSATTGELKQQGGTSIGSVSNVSATALGKVNFDFDAYDSTNTSSYLPANPTKTWQWSAKVNFGLPFLLNTQQLVRIEFDTQMTDGTKISSADITNEVIDNEKIRLKVDNKYFVRVSDDSSPKFKTSVNEKSDTDYEYKFSEWTTDYTTLKTPFTTNFTQVITLPKNATTMGYADRDKIFVAQYVKRDYTVTVNPSATERVQTINVDSSEKSTATVQFNSGKEVTILVTPQEGYKVSGLTPAVNGDFVTKSDDGWTLNVDSYIRELGKTCDTDAVEKTGIFVTANLEPDSYSVYLHTNDSDCAGGALIKSNDVTALSNGALVSYQQTLYLVVDPTGIKENYKFDKWQYQIVNKGASVNSNAWKDVPNENREDSIPFVVKDMTDSQELHFMANFKPVSYTLTIENTNTEAGSITLQDVTGTALSKSEFYFYEPAYIKIDNKYGYYFDSVKINGITYSISKTGSLTYSSAYWNNSTKILTLNGFSANTSIAVDFKKCNYTVSFSLATQNFVSDGTTVTDSNDKSLLGQNYSVNYKDIFAFKVNVEPGYDIVSVTAEGQTLSLQDNGYYKPVITGNTQIKVLVSKQKFTVSADFAYAGDYNYSVDKSNIHGVGDCYYGSELNIKFDCPDMFNVDYWIVNGTKYFDKTNTYSLNSVTETISITIGLSIKTAKISFSQSGDSGNTSKQWYSIYANNKTVEFQPTMSDININYGDSVQFSVAEQYFNGERNTMYQFAYWQVNNKTVSQERAFSLIANQDKIAVLAVFKPAQIAVNANCYELNNKTGALTKLNDIGSIIGLSTATASYGSTVTLTATACDGYKFVGWQNASGSTLSSAKSYAFDVREEVDIRAVFVKLQKLTIFVDSEQGSCVGAGEQIVYDTVKVTATAKKNYQFVSWTSGGEVVSKNAEFTFAMPNNDVSLTAVFERVYAIKCSTNDKTLGQVVGDTSGKFKENVTLEAICANNCSFVGWMVNDVLISNSTKLNISMNGDVEVQALFKKNFNWNIVIVILGSALFALVMVYGAIYFIRSKEAQPINTRSLIGSKDDSDIIRKASKHNALRDEIAPVPTRKIQRVNVQPVPVRKIAVAPTDHKGNKVKPSQKAKDKKATLKTEE